VHSRITFTFIQKLVRLMGAVAPASLDPPLGASNEWRAGWLRSND